MAQPIDLAEHPGRRGSRFVGSPSRMGTAVFDIGAVDKTVGSSSSNLEHSPGSGSTAGPDKPMVPTTGKTGRWWQEHIADRQFPERTDLCW